MRVSELEQMISSVPKDLLSLIPGYLDRREKEVRHLFDMLERQDFLSIKDVAHKIKGSGAGYGLNVYTDLGSDLEIAATLGNRQEVKRTIEKIDAITWTLKRCLPISDAA